MESKYLKFSLLEKKPKTLVIEVKSKLHGYRLGVIKWFALWRQYSFYPEPNTIFNTECMKDIFNYIKLLEKIHKERLKGSRMNCPGDCRICTDFDCPFIEN